LFRRIDETQPDVVLYEAGSRDVDLHGALKTIAPLDTAVVLLTDDAGPQYIRAGARGVLAHGASEREILAAIEAAAAGLITISADAFEPPPPAERILTAREVEILRMLAEGIANKEIAFRLGLSEHTVKFHVAQVFNKLNVSSRTEAVTAGLRQGLILL
jgi:DNA-binding NarL/FixJ family response regulator